MQLLLITPTTLCLLFVILLTTHYLTQAPRPFDLKFKRPASVARKIEEMDNENSGNVYAKKGAKPAQKAPGGLFGMCSCCNNDGDSNEVSIQRRK